MSASDGSIILPEKLSGAASVLKPEHFGCANAIGSAISKTSGTYEKLMNYDELPREQSLEKAKSEAVELAVKAGAVRETVEIIEMEDVPLAYYPGNTNRVKIKAADTPMLRFLYLHIRQTSLFRMTVTLPTDHRQGLVVSGPR